MLKKWVCPLASGPVCRLQTSVLLWLFWHQIICTAEHATHGLSCWKSTDRWQRPDWQTTAQNKSYIKKKPNSCLHYITYRAYSVGMRVQGIIMLYVCLPCMKLQDSATSLRRLRSVNTMDVRIFHPTWGISLNIFVVPSVHFPESVQGRGDPWLLSDCCRRSLSDRDLCVWKSSCRTNRILQSPESPGSRPCLHPADNHKNILWARNRPNYLSVCNLR